MLGTIVLLLVIGVVLYLLWTNDKLNMNSVNQSSDQILKGSAGDGNAESESFFNQNSKNLRITHGEDGLSTMTVLERPLKIEQIIEQGNRLNPGSVFMGVVDPPLNGIQPETRTTQNFVIKQFKNMFIVFKGLDFTEIDINNLMVRYEANNLVYVLIDALNNSLPELLRDVNYPICVLVNNSSAQLLLREWGYTQINDIGTVFVKNEKSFRFQ